MPISPQQYNIRIGSFIENRNKKIKYKSDYSNYKSKYKKMTRIVIPLLLLCTFGYIMDTVIESDCSVNSTHSMVTDKTFSSPLLTTQVCSSVPGTL